MPRSSSPAPSEISLRSLLPPAVRSAPSQDDPAEDHLEDDIQPQSSSSARGVRDDEGAQGLLGGRNDQWARESRTYHTWLKRIGIALAIQAAIVILLFLLFGVILPSSSSSPSSKGSLSSLNGICQTKECNHLAQKMRENINTTVHPCDDFYAHACGGWIAGVNLTQDLSSFTRFMELHKSNMELLRDILDGSIEPTLSSDPEEITVDKTNLANLRSMYSACMDIDTIESLGASPIHPLFSLVRSHFSPGAPHVSSDQLSSLIGKLFSRGITTFLSIQVFPDTHSPKEHLLHIGQSGISFPNAASYHTKSVALHFPTHIRRLLSLTLEKGIQQKFGTEELTRIAQNIWEFETKLAATFASGSVIFDPTKSYNIYSLGNVSSLISTLDIHRVMDSALNETIRLMGQDKEDTSSSSSSSSSFNATHHTLLRDITLNNDTRIQISAPTYLKALDQLLSDTSAETVQWYFLWKVIATFAPHLTSEISNVYQEVEGLSSGVTGIADPSRRWETCVDYVEDAAGFSLGRYFVQASFTGITKKLAIQMIQSIKGEFEQQATTLAWLDDPTREALIAKVSAIGIKVGYPDEPNVKSPFSLAEWYNGANTTTGDHVGNFLSFLALESCMQLGKIGQPVKDGTWTDNPSTVNAYYDRHHNEVVFPAGILQAPFFNSLLPDYINYGSMGMFVGHELSHAFDNIGRQYDAKGSLNDWWTPKTSQIFSNKTQCFVDQLKRNQTFFFPPWAGNLTEMSDNSGISQAERSWAHRLGKAEPGRNSMLPEVIPGATPKKLFYYAYAQNFCQKIRADKLSENLFSDPHPPMRLRILSTLQNSVGFSTAFQCPLGSPMNPESKCQLW
ncbi:MAG: hypothetical protein DHS80DRAFT_13217 [Piptocephalis tieghemiana]|nr:MAG: hypothetical protein DHS80DRAFT_13217 [Piptocephalis tieghemiana]